MSREIKFRAWDTANERMVDEPYRFDVMQEYQKTTYGWKGDYIFYETWQDVDDGIDRPCFIMQYTGLKDKNGKEIYEGDIIKWNRGFVDDSVMDTWPSEPYVCKFQSGRFFLNCQPNGFGGYTLTFTSNGNKNGTMIYCEIIGNIFQHPELLTQPVS